MKDRTMPWEISAGLAGVSLLAFAVVSAAAFVEIRNVVKSAAVLTAALDRHIPAIRQNLEETRRNADALRNSIQALSAKAAGTGKGFEIVAGEIRDLERAVQEELVVPLHRIAALLSGLLAFESALRRLGHPVRLLRRGKREA